MAIKNGNNVPEGDSGGEIIIIPLEPKDQFLPIDNIRTMVFIVVRDILNEEKMRDALDHLIRDHLPILGARIESNSKAGGLAYHLPKTFSANYELFRWSNQTIQSSLEGARLLPQVTRPDCDILFGPASVPELEKAWIPSSWPKERKFEQPNTPLLLVHLAKYEDATVVALNLPHAVSDQMGFGSMITAWINVINGEKPAEFLELKPGSLDGLPSPSQEILRKKNAFRIMTKVERVRAIMSFLPDFMINPKEIRRTVFLPVKIVEDLRDRHTQALRTKYGENALALTSGDIVTGILAKFAFLGRKKARMSTITAVVNARGRLPALPANKPYLHNCTIYATPRLPLGHDTPLVEIAYEHRSAVIEALRQENMQRNLAVLKEFWRKKDSIHIVEPGELSFSSLNWCGAWRDIDFGPAATRGETAVDRPRTAAHLILGHSLERHSPTRYNTQIMCKAEGGFWCDFTASTKTMSLVEKLLESDPKLERI